MLKKLLSGLVFIFFAGLGCFGFLYMTIFDDVCAIVTATSVTTLVLLITYTLMAYLINHKRMEKGISKGSNCEGLRRFVVIASVIIIALAISAVLFGSWISDWLSEHPKGFRLVVSILFLLALILSFAIRNRMKNKL